MPELLAPADSAALLVDDDPVTAGEISEMRGVVEHPCPKSVVSVRGTERHAPSSSGVLRIVSVIPLSFYRFRRLRRSGRPTLHLLTIQSEITNTFPCSESCYVPCLYYFAVMLITRPILVLTRTAPPANDNSAGFESASAFIDASIHLVESCIEGHQANLLLSDRCMMKALLFPEGLTLGFDIFASRNTGHEVETALRSVRDILYHFSVMSPLAAHYLEILTMLSSTISKKRETIASRRGNRYGSRIQTLMFSAEEPGQDSWQQKQVHNAPARPGEGTVLPTNGDGTEVMATKQQPSQPLEFDSAFVHRRDNSDILQWDNFLV
ncbi:hypothetical protein V2G26_002089 [Clonostachys chloroleuca]